MQSGISTPVGAFLEQLLDVEVLCVMWAATLTAHLL